MKAAHKGTVTKFVQENKPKGSPIPKNWFENGGSLSIETMSDGSQIWKYTNADGVTVPYIPKEINGQIIKVVEFPEEYMFAGDQDLATVSIGEFTGDRTKDIQLAKEVLEAQGITDFKGYVLHHDYENGIIKLVDKRIHAQFSHYGGYYLYR